MKDITKTAMFKKRVKYYIYYPEELELTVKVVKEAFQQAKEWLDDIDRMDTDYDRNQSY